MEELAPEQEAVRTLRDQNENAGEHGGRGTEFARAGHLALFARLLPAMLGCFLGLVVFGHDEFFLVSQVQSLFAPANSVGKLE